MKFNKFKFLIAGVSVGLLLNVTPVLASTLKIESVSTTDKEAKYELYLDATEPIENLSIKIDASNTSATKVISKADNVEATCDNTGCSEIKIDSTGKKKIANITLSNSTANQIDNLILTATASTSDIEAYSTTAVSLKGITTTTTTQKVLSSKAELTGLTVSVGTLSPSFSEGEKNYTVTDIKDTINSITFNPTCDNCTLTYTCKENCSVSQTKNNKILLEEGANIIRIVSDSQDQKNSAEYIFTVYRGEIEEPSAYLTDLSIKDVEISPKFDMLLNDYTATVDKDVEKLEINYTLEDPEAKVDIKGADELKEGENTITITVTSSDSKSKQVYTIIVTKEDICDPEKEECETEEVVKEEVKVVKKKSNKTLLIVLLTVGALAIIAISWFIIFKKKKKNNKNDKDDKNNKGNKKSKIKDMIIEPDEVEGEEDNLPLENDLLKETEKETNNEPEIIKPRIKPSVDEALEDLMKTKEIELNN